MAKAVTIVTWRIPFGQIIIYKSLSWLKLNYEVGDFCHEFKQSKTIN